ncbi:hypothetical protein ACFDTO_35415 [Microbacteriaceae bacterium 4G12]
MLYTNTIIPMCLAIIFFILFLSSDKKDKSILLMSIFFGVMSIDHKIVDNALKGTKFETAWKIFYCLMMIVLIVVMTRDIIQKLKNIKTRTKSKK